MKNREPVDLKVVLIVYNFAMVLLSAYMFHEVCHVDAIGLHKWLCVS